MWMPYPGNGIDGWMTPLELEFLFQNAKEMGSVIEVGSWKGRSTHALLSGCPGTVIAVDHFLGSKEESTAHAEAKKPGDLVYEAFMRNVGHFRNLVVKRMDTLEAAKECGLADMVFVDCGHSYEEVKEDIRNWGPKARKLLCGHDYCPAWPGVRQAVDEAFGRPDGVCGSIWFKAIEHEQA